MVWLRSFLAAMRIRTGVRSLLDCLCDRVKGARRPTLATVTWSLLVFLLATGPGSPLTTGWGIGTAYAAGNSRPRVSHDPNTLSRFRSSGNAWGQRPSAIPPDERHLTIGHGKGPDNALPSTGTSTTHPVIVALDTRFFAAPTPKTGPRAVTTSEGPTPITWYKSQEGLLEVGLAESSIDLSEATIGGKPLTVDPLTAPAGTYIFNFTQTQGGFRGQMAQLAQFDLRLQDAQGHVLDGVRFSQPLTLRLHYAKHELDGLNPFAIALYWPATADVAHNVGAASVPLSIDPKNQTLTAELSALHRGTVVLASTTTDANQASSEHLRMDDNQGDVSFSVPFDLPPAAGGLVPNLQLVYSSAGPNGRSSRTSPAPAAGDGWNLGLGSISYDSGMHMYFLNGVGGVSDPLLCCMQDSTGAYYFVPHHHPSVRVFTANNTQDPATANSDASCFKVYTPDGLEYDLGCTLNSRRQTLNSSGTALVAYQWDVNLVLKRSTTSSTYLQQYGVTYWTDVSTINGMNVIRDSVPGEIDYNYSGGQPQARVYVNVHWPGANQWLTAQSAPERAFQYGSNYNCASTPSPTTTLRCDDPVNNSSSGWAAAPYTMSTITIDTIGVQVYDGGAWHYVRRWDLTYAKDVPFSVCYPFPTYAAAACAGEHVLTSIQEYPYQNDTAMPSRQPLTFGYTGLVKNEYHDTTHLDSNRNPYDAQTWWKYLNSFYDKETGASGTLSYATAYGNTHGVTSGNVLDPTTCDTASNCSGSQAWPDDRQWPRQIVTSITDRGTGTVTNFSYRLNQACGTNCTQDSWIPPNGWNACGDSGLPPQPTNQTCLDGNWTNYFDEEFTGFSQVITTNPDSSTSVDTYFAGAGWGTNDWDDGNRLRGKLWFNDTYQGAASGAPLKEVKHTYSNNTPTYCVSTNGNNQLYVPPYLMCEVFELQRDTYLGGASSATNVPRYTEKWNYYAGWTTSVNHFYEQMTSSSVSSNDMLADSYTPVGYGTTQPTFTTNYTYTWHDGALDATRTNFYIINQLAQQTLDDSASPSTRWSCAQTSYDGQAYATGQTSNLTAGLATRTDIFASGACGDSASILTTGSGYDVYGQKIVTTDADALAGISGHSGCAAPVTPLKVYPSGATTYTTCATYGTIQSAYVTNTGNALNQHITTTFDVVQGVQLTATDANGAVTNMSTPVYEYSGTPASLGTYLDQYSATALPGETYGGTTPWTTRVYTYSFCATTSMSETRPCMETDTVSQLNGANLTVKREFYDRDGRLIETRSSGPDASTDVVTITSYDDVHDKQFTGVPCSVAALSTSNGGRTSNLNLTGYVAPAQTSTGSGAYVDPTNTASGNCYNPVGATTYRDAMGRTVATDDALGTGAGASGSGCILGSVQHTTCTTYMPVLASTTSGLPSTDSEPYLQAVTVDPDLHQSAVYTDARGKTAYTQRFTGSNQSPLGTGIASYAVVSYQYDPSGNQRIITDPGNHAITYTYDKAGRKTGMTDTDLGTWTYSYDQNGNLTSSVDPRGAGSSGTTLIGDTTIEPDLDSDSAGSAEALAYTASTSGSIGSFSLYLDSSNTATQVKVGIYTDNGSGSPGTLLAKATITSPNAGAWNTVTLLGANVTAGSTYWLAILAPAGTGTVAFRDCAACTGQGSQNSAETTLTTLPSTWSAGAGWTTSSMSAYITSTSTSPGTVYIGYDGLNRQLWRNGSNTPTGAYALSSYDSTANGNNGIGRQTGETFNSGDSYGSGSYNYTYDARGQRTAQSITIENNTYTFGFGYDDAGHLTSQRWSDNESTATGYSATGWLASVVTTPSGGTQTNLLTGISYSGVGGLSMRPTSASAAGGTYSFSSSYDNDLRLTSNSLTNVSTGATLFQSNRTYDAASNVSSIGTTSASGSDSQAFCYDEQNRLTWSSSASTSIPCGGANTAGTLTAASYTQSFAYDRLGRLITGPAGTYTYGDSAHLHAVTSTSNGYTAAYDTAGDMFCRAPTSNATCSGTRSGAYFSYDRERRMTHWEDPPNSPTSIDDLRYDGEGNRIELRTVQGGTTTTTYYLLGGQEEVQIVSGGATTVTKYYPTGSATRLPQPMKVGTTISYLATDGLGTVSEAVDSAGNVTAQQLYLPYGGSRYTSGTMPTSKGFTGQRTDAATGLDYYDARYYDPVLGQFISADDAGDGLNHYAYVHGNPETLSDPTGHKVCNPDAPSAGCTHGPPPPDDNSGDQVCRNNGGCYKTDPYVAKHPTPSVPKDPAKQREYFYNLAVSPPWELEQEGLPPYAPNGMPWGLFFKIYYGGTYYLQAKQYAEIGGGDLGLFKFVLSSEAQDLTKKLDHEDSHWADRQDFFNLRFSMQAVYVDIGAQEGGYEDRLEDFVERLGQSQWYGRVADSINEGVSANPLPQIVSYQLQVDANNGVPPAQISSLPYDS